MDCWVFIVMLELHLVVVLGLLILMASLVAEHRLQVHKLPWAQLTYLVTLRHVESSGTRDRTLVPCIGRWILNHWIAREVLFLFFDKGY